MLGKINWPTTQLEEVCEHITVGHVGPMVDQYREAGIPFLRSQNVRPFRFDPAELKFISPEFHTKLKKSALRPRDVVVTRSGANTGQCCVIPPQLSQANCSDLVIFRPSKMISPWYLMYVLNSDWGRAIIAGGVVGAAQHHFNIGIAKKVSIRLPPLAMQQRIAGILLAYDELMENSRRRIRVLESMACALYREWFVHFRFPGYEKFPRVTSPLGQIPKGWEVRRIGEVADTFRGRSYRSVDLAEDGGLPFLNLKCLNRDGGFRRSGLKRYIGEYKDSHVAKTGDIVMAVTDMTQERRIVARAALVPKLDKEFGISSMDLVRIEPKPPMPKAFLYSFLRHSSFADEVKQHANGANVLHLAPERITDFRFPIPSGDLMRRFANFVAPILNQMDTLENKSENLRRTRDLLLPHLLSGQVVMNYE
jgi:type I restriction enzyme, S subunit